MSAKLMILDFSGTLSLRSALFAAPARLSAELERCGLKGLGVETCDMFWEMVVNPTWQEGSTTGAGYKAVMKRILQDAFHVEASVVSPAVESFINAYLGESKIDPSWKPLLVKLSTHPGVKTIIASDHYAEATDAILASLADMGVKAVSLRNSDRCIRDVSFVVANSADIGFHKVDQGFWESVKAQDLPERVEKVLIVDDFGANEQEGNRYAEREKVKTRIQDTAGALEKVFQAEVEVFPFILEGGCTRDDSLYRNLIDEVSKEVDQFLI